MSPSSKYVLVSDYGRSGQGWLSYMLCYCLNAKFIEPYDLLIGRKYTSSEHILSLTGGNLPGRERTPYELIVKTHSFPAPDFGLTDKVIYLTRDPRDVAVSGRFRFRNVLKTHKNLSLPSRIKARIKDVRVVNYLLTAYGWQKHVRAWENIPHYAVRYEDMWHHPKETVQGILDFLEVKVDPKRVEEAVAHFSFEKITGRKRGEQDSGNSEFRKGVIGDYKNHFSGLELKLFWRVCGKRAEKLGYPRSPS